ncbi:MAG: hypothetical protein COV45_03010 [Deltaproteobacteria bacterium CG11_big_fil_rev_8_21_14_0_20_47_16]|nr:MAG: hypothetical protein COV45_03010 [Deltaproteobacteria bacterium CG11_big_fil_rev_8_21_14_0_20_47_16]
MARDNIGSTLFLPPGVRALLGALASHKPPTTQVAVGPTRYEEALDDAAARLQFAKLLGDPSRMKGSAHEAVQLLEGLRARGRAPNNTATITKTVDLLVAADFPNLALRALSAIADAASGYLDFVTAADAFMRMGAIHMAGFHDAAALRAIEQAARYYTLAGDPLAAVAFHLLRNLNHELESLKTVHAQSRAVGDFATIISASTDVLNFYIERESDIRSTLGPAAYSKGVAEAIVDSLAAYYNAIQEGIVALFHILRSPVDMHVDAGWERDLRHWGERMMSLVTYAEVLWPADLEISSTPHDDVDILKNYISHPGGAAYFDAVQVLARRHNLSLSAMIALISSPHNQPEAQRILRQMGFSKRAGGTLLTSLRDRSPARSVLGLHRLLEEAKQHGL